MVQRGLSCCAWFFGGVWFSIHVVLSTKRKTLENLSLSSSSFFPQLTSSNPCLFPMAWQSKSIYFISPVPSGPVRKSSDTFAVFTPKFWIYLSTNNVLTCAPVSVNQLYKNPGAWCWDIGDWMWDSSHPRRLIFSGSSEARIQLATLEGWKSEHLWCVLKGFTNRHLLVCVLGIFQSKVLPLVWVILEFELSSIDKYDSRLISPGGFSGSWEMVCPKAERPPTKPSQ